jgi:hypothetical protein
MDKELVDAKYNELRDEITKYGLGMADDCRIHKVQVLALSKTIHSSVGDMALDLYETTRVTQFGFLRKMAELCLIVEQQATRIALLEDKLREGM